MKILITGATGLIGRKLVTKLLNNDYSINFLTSNKKKIDSISKCKGFYWNPQKGKIDKSAFNGVSYLINLAGVSISKPWTTKNKKNIVQSRILSSQIIYNSLVDINHKLDGLVSASAIGYYPSSKHLLYEEKYSYNNEGFLGAVVEKWEKSLNELEVYTNQLCKLRIGLVLSDNGGVLSKMTLPIKMGLGSAFGSGDQWQSWIHIDDLTELILYSIENKFSGVYNAVAPNPVTQNNLIKVLARKLKRPIILPNIPKYILKILLKERSHLILDSHKVSSKKVLETGFKFRFNKIDQAIRDLKL